MPAKDDEMKAILLKAMLDSTFRASLMSDPSAAVREMGVALSDNQVELLKQASKRLANVDLRNLRNVDMTVRREVGLGSGDPIGPVSGHGSVTW